MLTAASKSDTYLVFTWGFFTYIYRRRLVGRASSCNLPVVACSSAPPAGPAPAVHPFSPGVHPFGSPGSCISAIDREGLRDSPCSVHSYATGACSPSREDSIPIPEQIRCSAGPIWVQELSEVQLSCSYHLCLHGKSDAYLSGCIKWASSRSAEVLVLLPSLLHRNGMRVGTRYLFPRARTAISS